MDELLMERYHLAKDRISEICIEKTAQPDFEDFFKKTAAFLTKTAAILEREKEELTEEELAQENRELYEELFPENYGTCYGNPSYAAVRKNGGIIPSLQSFFWKSMLPLRTANFRQ